MSEPLTAGEPGENIMKRASITDEADMLPAPKEELERRLEIFELATDIERQMLRGLWLEDDHRRLFTKTRARGFHPFD